MAQKRLRTPDLHYFPSFFKQTTFNNHEKNLVLLHGYMKGQRISAYLYTALSLNNSLHARKSHVFRKSLYTSSFIFFKNISHVACSISLGKFKPLYLKRLGALNVVSRKMSDFRARKSTVHRIGRQTIHNPQPVATVFIMLTDSTQDDQGNPVNGVPVSQLSL